MCVCGGAVVEGSAFDGHNPEPRKEDSLTPTPQIPQFSFHHSSQKGRKGMRLVPPSLRHLLALPGMTLHR